jgi:tRNA-2-methylthio-N6-dimethylallyladenosine synthase
MAKYFLETYGCQMNVHDSERIAGLLEHDGYERTDDERHADVVVVNTCSVRERAEDKLYTRLGEIRDATADRLERPVIAVTGCVAQQEGARLLKRHLPVNVVAGTQRLKDLPDLIREARQRPEPQLDVRPHDDVSFPLGLVKHSDAYKALVTIIEGCNEFCSFCVVPYTRGNERMRPVADILAEVHEAVRSGRSEIQLLGQIVNHYQAPDDPACDFAELLERVSRIEGVLRVRFASPHPRHVSDRLIRVLRDVPQVCKHLHMPVQSGSNRVLTAMRRRYTRESYLEIIHRLREVVPGIAVSTDVIVGFPGETDEDFELTLDLARDVQFHSMYSFKYSTRPNTLASKRLADDVTEAEKTRRILALQALQRDIQGEWYRRALGTTEAVLVDATSRRRDWELAGRTTGNTIVNFPGPQSWLGRLMDVRITGAGPNSLRGESVELSPLVEAAHAD